jgi:pimeloyl-[acyl-carrier protein] methyl ester esterase
MIERALPAEGRFVLLGESFSGPLALRIAARGHPRLAAVVLIASFARNPLPRVGAWLRPFVGSWCFRFAPPRWVIRRFLAGADAPSELIDDFQAAVWTVSAAVMAKRAKEVLAVDVRRLLPQIRVPVLLLSAARDRLVSSKTKADFAMLEERFEQISMDAPHLILQRRATEAVEAIDSFMKRKLHADEVKIED